MNKYISNGYQRKYENQDINTKEWKDHKKHFLILSSSGKPVYSRYGDEITLSSMMSLIQAFLAFFQEEQDPLKYIKVSKSNQGSGAFICILHHGTFVLYLSLCNRRVARNHLSTTSALA
jgi:hypothetical protein